MPLDTSDYYPYTPGSGCDPDAPGPGNEPDKDPAPDNAVPAQTPATEGITSGTAGTQQPASTPCPPEDPSSSTDDAPPKGFATGLSHVLSWVLSPVLMPTYAIIMVFALSMLSYAPARSKWIITGIVFGMTCLIPCIAVYILTRFGDVKDVALTRRTDRFIPYVITGACMLGCGLYLNVTGLPHWVGNFYIGAAIATAVCLLVNFRWKISAHGCGMGGFIAMILVLNRYGLPPYNLWIWCISAVAFGGMLGAARVWLGRHTPMQTVIGETVGFLGVISVELMLNVEF